MRFKEIFVAGFGCLRELRLPLDGQFNLILAPNDEGKTTLQNFITAVLFPFSEKQHRQRFKPWGHEPYGGNLRYALSNGEEFEIHKQITGQTARTDLLRLFLKPSNQEVTDRYPSSRQGPLIAETQLNMTRESFEGIPVVKQLQVVEIGDDKVRRSVTEKIKSLVTTGKEDMGLEKALSRLDSRLDEIGKTDRGTGTEAGKADHRVRELEKQYESLKALHVELESLLEEIKTLKQKLGRFKQEERQWDYRVKSARFLDLKRKHAEVESLRASCEQKYGEQIPEEELVQFLKKKENELLEYKKIEPECIGELQSSLAEMRENDILTRQGQKDIEETKQQLASCEVRAADYPKPYSAISAADLRVLRALEQRVSQGQEIFSRQEAEHCENTVRRSRIESGSGTTKLLFEISAALFLASLVSLFWLPVWVLGISAISAAAAASCWFRLRRAKAEIRGLDRDIAEGRAQLFTAAEEVAADLGQAQPVLAKIPGAIRPEAAKSLDQSSEVPEMADRLRFWSDFYAETKSRFLEEAACQNYDEFYERLITFQQLGEEIGKLKTQLTNRQNGVEDLNRKTETLRQQVFHVLGKWFPETEADPSVEAAETCVEQIKEKQRDYEALERDHAHLLNLLERKDHSAFLAGIGGSQKLVDELLAQDPRLVEIKVELGELGVYEQRYQQMHQELTEARELLLRKETERDEKLRGRPELADVESDLEGARQNVERISLYRDSLVEAGQLLREAGKNVYTDIAPRLNRFLTTRVSQLSDGRYSETSMDEELNLTVKIKGIGSYQDAEVLGGGMRCGLYLLLRIGILGLIGEEGEETPPLIMDEAFNSFDDFGLNRLERMVNLLCDILRQNPSLQLIYFTCQEKGQYLPIKEILQSQFAVVTEKKVGNFRIAGAG